MGVEPNGFPTYRHEFDDGRTVHPKAYPERLLPEFRMHFREVWLPDCSLVYFRERDPDAIPFLQELLNNNIPDDIAAE